MSENKDWALGKVNDGENSLILRLRKNLPDWCQKQSMPHLIVISWPCSGDQGMPSDSENQEQITFEDLLDKGFDSIEHSLLTLVITGGNVKEWQWYTQNPEAFMQTLNSILPQDKALPISLSHQDDSGWEAYHKWNPEKQ